MKSCCDYDGIFRIPKLRPPIVGSALAKDGAVRGACIPDGIPKGKMFYEDTHFAATSSTSGQYSQVEAKTAPAEPAAFGLKKPKATPANAVPSPACH